MASPTLTPTPIGETNVKIGANRIFARQDLALIGLAIPLGGEAALQDALGTGALPEATRVLDHDIGMIMRTGQDSLLVMRPRDSVDPAANLHEQLGAHAYITDQSDAFAVFEIIGPDTRAALERLCPLDIDPATFPPGACAQTAFEHMNTTILCQSRDQYVLFCPSSSVTSFAEALETAFRSAQP
ncbi:MAG: hypothetical protein AAF748_07395 [Pseudomonadota bacterium]